MYISYVNHQGRILKLRSLYIIRQSSRNKFKVAVCIYHMSIIKEEDLKLRYVEIIRQSSRKKIQSCVVYISYVNLQGISLYVNHQGRSLKLRCVYIIRQSSRKKFKVAVSIYHTSIIKE